MTVRLYSIRSKTTNYKQLPLRQSLNFEAKYPGWKVRHDVISNGYNGIRTKVVQDLQGKKQPDLAYCYPDHVALYMQTEKVIDLKNLINSAETVKDANGNDVRIGFTTNENC